MSTHPQSCGVIVLWLLTKIMSCRFSLFWRSVFMWKCLYVEVSSCGCVALWLCRYLIVSSYVVSSEVMLSDVAPVSRHSSLLAQLHRNQKSHWPVQTQKTSQHPSEWTVASPVPPWSCHVVLGLEGGKGGKLLQGLVHQPLDLLDDRPGVREGGVLCVRKRHWNVKNLVWFYFLA